jgi:hypothetical protein
MICAVAGTILLGSTLPSSGLCAVNALKRIAVCWGGRCWQMG